MAILSRLSKRIRAVIPPLAFLIVSSTLAQGAPSDQGFSYQGRFMNEDGTAPLTGSIDVTFAIYEPDPSGTCLLYEETQTGIDLDASDGYVSLRVGSPRGAAQRSPRDPDKSMAQIFANGSEIRSAGSPQCADGYTPQANDSRRLQVTVTPQAGAPVTLSPDLVIAAAPLATVAETLQGLAPADFLRTSTNATQLNIEALVGGANASSLHKHDDLYAKLGELGGAGLNLTGVGPGVGDGKSLRWDATEQEWEAYTPAAGGGISEVTGTAPVVVNNGTTTPSISVGQASGVAAGILSAADYLSFSSKLSGSLASGNILVGNGSGSAAAVALSGDATLSNTGALALKDTGTPGTYTKVTTDAQGRVSAGAALALGDLPRGTAGDVGFPLLSQGAGADSSYAALNLSSTAATGVPDCDDTTGKHLNYDATTHTFSCGTSSSAASSQWEAATGGINYAGGNVGIGTTAPGYAFTVSRTSTSSSPEESEAYFDYYANPPVNLRSRTGLSARITTSNANTKSSVVGLDSYARNDGTGAVTHLTGALGHVYSGPGSTTTNATGIEAFAFIDGNVSTLRGVSVTSGNLDGTIGDHVGVDIDMGSATKTNEYGLRIANSGTATTGNFAIYQVTSGVNNYFAGNVGIGTTAPTNPLHVLRSTSGNIAMFQSSDPVAPVTIAAPSQGRPSLIFDNAGVGAYRIGLNGGAGPSQNIQFIPGYDVNNSPAVVFRGDGNVGIGTTSPAQKLSVAGTIESTSGGFKFPDGTTQGTAATGVDLSAPGAIGATTPSSAVFTTVNSSNGITSTIGVKALSATAAPAPIATSALVELGSGGFAGGGGGNFSGSASGTVLGSNMATGFAGNFADFQVNGTSKFSVSGAGDAYFAGKVGIGTASPAGPFVVNTAASFTGNILELQHDTAPVFEVDAYGVASTKKLAAEIEVVTPVIQGGYSAGLDLTIDSTGHATKGKVLIAPNGGNVGIGTTTPTSKLSVAAETSGPGVGLKVGLNDLGGGAGKRNAITTSYGDGSFHPYVAIENTLPFSYGTSSRTGVANLFRAGANATQAYGLSNTAAAGDYVVSGTGSSFYGVYNQFSSTQVYGSNSKLYGIYNDLSAANDPGNQESVYGSYTVGTTFANGDDRYYGAYMTGSASSTGGTQYGVYVDLTPGTATKYPGIFMGGNFGIGTATPAELLSVAGVIQSTSGGFKFPDGTTQATAATTVNLASPGAIGGTTPSSAAFTTVSSSSGITSTSGVKALAATSAPTAIATSALVELGSGGFAGGGGGNFSGSASGTVLGSNMATGFAGNFADFQVNGSSKFSVSGAGDAYFAGKVGIGTSTLSETLNVAGTMSVSKSSSLSILNKTAGIFAESTGSNSGAHVAILGDASQTSGTALAGNKLIGGSFSSYLDTLHGTSSVIGVEAWAGNNSNGSLYGARIMAEKGGNETVSVLAGSDISVVAGDGSGGTITDNYGVKIDLQSYAPGTLTNRYGLHLQASGDLTPTNDFGIYQATATQKNYFAGNVGIGTTSPGAKLDVTGSIRTSGQISSGQNIITTGASVDFDTGNTQILNAPGGTAITLTNMKDGGAYTVIITDGTSRTYTFTNCTNSHFSPANGPTVSTTQSIYSIIKTTQAGATHCYISWITGFN